MRRGETLTNLKFGTFIGRFSSDDPANMAVKGLKVALLNSFVPKGRWQRGYTRAYFPGGQTGCRYTLTYLPKNESSVITRSLAYRNDEHNVSHDTQTRLPKGRMQSHSIKPQ